MTIVHLFFLNESGRRAADYIKKKKKKPRPGKITELQQQQRLKAMKPKKQQ
jgi:hypothetical protein